MLLVACRWRVCGRGSTNTACRCKSGSYCSSCSRTLLQSGPLVAYVPRASAVSLDPSGAVVNAAWRCILQYFDYAVAEHLFSSCMIGPSADVVSLSAAGFRCLQSYLLYVNSQIGILDRISDSEFEMLSPPTAVRVRLWMRVCDVCELCCRNGNAAIALRRGWSSFGSWCWRWTLSPSRRPESTSCHDFTRRWHRV
jgi:hypothetical protein